MRSEDNGDRHSAASGLDGALHHDRLQVHLEDGRWESASYNSKYVVILQDQQVLGVIDSVTE